MSHISKNVACNIMKNTGNKALASNSKEWIVQALLLLMHKKSFDRITIKEISEKAGVDRKTFHRNFDSKLDVLKLYLDRLCGEYIENLNNEKKLTTFSIAKIYFEFCLKHIDFLHILDKSNMLVFILSAYDKYLPEIHKIFENKGTFIDPVYHSGYALPFLTGGFWNITVKWIKNNTPKTPTEMATIVEKLMVKPL